MCPFLAYLGCMYSVAFNKVSLVVSIFVMGVMLHPFIVIPLAVCAKKINKIGYNFYIKKVKRKANTKQHFSSISIILYLGFIALNQMYLYITWVNFREERINQNCQNTTLTDAECANSFKTANSFGSQLFNQCDCQELGEDACVNTDSTTDTFLEDVFSSIPQDNIPHILIGYTILLIILHLIQNYIPCLRLPPSIPMNEFILVELYQTEVEYESKVNDRNNSVDILVGSIYPGQIHTREKFSLKRFKKHKKRKLCTLGTISFVVALIFLISLYSSVYIVYPTLYEWKVSCNDGFYDTHPDPNIFKCTGNLQISNMLQLMY